MNYGFHVKNVITQALERDEWGTDFSAALTKVWRLAVHLQTLDNIDGWVPDHLVKELEEELKK